MRQAKGGRPTPEGAAQAGRQVIPAKRGTAHRGPTTTNPRGAKLNPSDAIIDHREREWEIRCAGIVCSSSRCRPA